MPLERRLSELLFTQGINAKYRPGGSKFEVVWLPGKTFSIYGVQGALTLLFMISSSERASGKCMEFAAGEPAGPAQVL